MGFSPGIKWVFLVIYSPKCSKILLLLTKIGYFFAPHQITAAAYLVRDDTCGAPLSAISMALSIISNWPGMFNEK